MAATAEPPALTVAAPTLVPLRRAEGVELLGPVHGCGYRDGAALVRRADGQMVQLGPLMYGLLECIDGERDSGELALALSDHLGRQVGIEHIVRIAEKLAAQGLLAGTEHRAPPRRNPLLALRWKVLVTDPVVTRRLTAPLTILFRPWLMWPVVAAFGAVFWFVLIHKGVASATAEAFHSPGLLLLVFALAVASAGFHELGHAAACRYGGATPGGMGVGLYLVWPAFYTDVTDTYRLPRRARLRVDLAGLYFNAVVADLTMVAWLVWRSDALLLLVALQVLQMVKQLSPVIRADGYHILSDATGIPDLYSQMGPTLRRLLPGHRHETTALNGRARLLVTLWVLIIVPVLISLSVSAILLLPRLGTSAFDSGRHIALAIPGQAGHGQIIDVLASLVRLLALALPVGGSILITQKVVRMAVARARDWSRDSAGRRGVVLLAGAAIAAAIAWAWWPSGQYRPVQGGHGGTLSGLVRLVSGPSAVARPGVAVAGPVSAAGPSAPGAAGQNAATPGAAAPVHLARGTHLAVSMVPVGGASRTHPALFVISRGRHRPPVAIVSTTAPAPSGAPKATTSPAGGPASATAPATTSSTPGGSTPGDSTATPSAPATAFPFQLPSPPGRHGTQALAENTTDGGVVYDVAYALVTVSGGTPVDETNSAYAIAHCRACTTVAVSFQIVLVVGRSRVIAPANVAGSLNYDCPACTTTALADQLVVTLTAAPPARLLAELEADLKQLGALPSLGAGGTPAAIAAQVAAVQQEVDTQLTNSGLRAVPLASSTSSSTSAADAPTSSASGATAGGSSPPSSSTTARPAAPTGSSPTTSTPPAASAPSSSAPPVTTTTSAAPPTSTSAAGTTPTTSTSSSATSTTTTTTTGASTAADTTTTTSPGTTSGSTSTAAGG